MATAQDGILYPVRFAATSYIVRVSVNSVAEDLNFPDTGTLTVGRNYYVSNDAQADASTNGGTGDLLTLLKATLDGHTETPTFTLTVSDGGLLTITASAGDFQIHWGHGNTTLSSSVFGFTAADRPAVAGLTTTSDQSMEGWWAANVPRRDDSRDRLPTIGSVGTTLSNKVRASSLVTSPRKTREVGWRLLAKESALDEYAAATGANSTFETAWRTGLSLGRRFRVYDDISDRTATSYSLYRMRTLQDPLDRDPEHNLRFMAPLSMLRGDY